MSDRQKPIYKVSTPLLVAGCGLMLVIALGLIASGAKRERLFEGPSLLLIILFIVVGVGPLLKRVYAIRAATGMAIARPEASSRQLPGFYARMIISALFIAAFLVLAAGSLEAPAEKRHSHSIVLLIFAILGALPAIPEIIALSLKKRWTAVGSVAMGAMGIIFLILFVRGLAPTMAGFAVIAMVQSAWLYKSDVRRRHLSQQL